MKKTSLYQLPTILMVALLWILLFPVLCQSGNLLNATESHSFQLPKYEKFTLKNGLTVYLMEQKEVPLIYVSAIFPAGAVKDGDKSGLASLTADTLLLGTKNYSKSQLEEKLDFLGTAYNLYTGKEMTSLSMSFINSDLDKVLPILKDIILHPSFEPTEFDKRKKRLAMELEQAKEETGMVINNYYEKFLFGTNEYGNPISGSKNSVAAITIEDIKAFYHANYKPAESAIAFVGNFKTQDMKKIAARYFNDWEGVGKSASTSPTPLPTYNTSRILLVNKEDATETRFFIGQMGIRNNNPDYVAIQVINTILGGRFTSWLNDELRVNAGLTYGVTSMFVPYKSAGTFLISSFTPTATTTEAIDLALKVIDRLHSQGIDEKTLTSAKNYLKGQFPPLYETAGMLANFLTTMFFYNLNDSFINSFQKTVDELTVEKAREIIQKYFPKDNLQFVLIGKASEIKDKIKKYGEIQIKEIKADGF